MLVCNNPWSFVVTIGQLWSKIAHDQIRFGTLCQRHSHCPKTCTLSVTSLA